MVDDDLELETDLGTATIVYDDPDEGTVEKTIANEHVAYFQDHWIIKTDEDDHGHDIIRRIPARRVHYVERSVEAFEEEVKTLFDRVESVATRLGTKIPIGGGSREERDQPTEPRRIDVESGTDDGSDTADR